jgi:predicted DNA-binding transcriptional regulator AlpA
MKSATPTPDVAPLTSNAGLDDLAAMRLSRVLEVYPVSKSTWWEGVRSGRFPKPLRLGARARAWRTSDIRALLAALKP